MDYCKICFAFVIISSYSQECTNGANILAVFPLPGKSRNMMYQKLLKGLADACHDVTTISPYEFKPTLVNGSVRDILLTGFAKEFKNINEDLEAFGSENMQMKTVINIYNRTYHHPNVQTLLTSNLQFDIVITDHLWSDSLLGFSVIFKCPLVLIITTTGGLNPWLSNMIGNPMLPSYIPHRFLISDFSKNLSFLERTYNLFFYLYDIIFTYFYCLPVHNEIIKSVPAFKQNSPDVIEFYQNVSLILSGSHLSIELAAPFVPNLVEIGGFHIDPPKELPQDLEDFLSDAKEGAIFFNIEYKNLSSEKIDMFLNVFGKLKMKVICKLKNKILSEKPKNVLIRKKATQMDILGHPSIRLFITDGSYDSTLEAVYHGVPALIIPIFPSQVKAAYLAQELGFALKLPYGEQNFNEDTLLTLIAELLDNPKYKENAKMRSKLFHDRPMKALDTAIFWTEYVIRHKGAEHLKVASVKMPLYKSYMLDVILLLIFIFILVILVLFNCLRIYFLRQPSKQKPKLH